MAQGNPQLRSYDQDLYQARTYYIDFSNLYKDKAEAVKEHCCDDVEEFEKLSEEEIDERFDNLIGHDLTDFKECFFEEFDSNETTIDELSSTSKGYALVLGETETGLILSTSDSENRHYVIGIVPKFKYEDILEERYNFYSHRKKWYEKRNLDFNAAIVRYAVAGYRKKLKAFRKENNPIMHKIHEEYKLSVRTSAWTSGSVGEVKHNFKFL